MESADMSGEIGIVLADKSPLVIAALKHLFGEDERFRVVATASDGERFLEAVERFGFDVGVIGWMMSYVDGRGVLAALRERANAVPIVIYTGATATDVPRQAMVAGAAGFYSKNAPPEKLLEIVADVADGRMVFPQMDLRRLMDDPLKDLTPREHGLLDLLVLGMTNARIARELDISINTVKFHLKNLYDKMNTENRAQTVARYLTVRHGVDDGTGNGGNNGGSNGGGNG